MNYVSKTVAKSVQREWVM